MGTSATAGDELGLGIEAAAELAADLTESIADDAAPAALEATADAEGADEAELPPKGLKLAYGEDCRNMSKRDQLRVISFSELCTDSLTLALSSPAITKPGTAAGLNTRSQSDQPWPSPKPRPIKTGQGRPVRV